MNVWPSGRSSRQEPPRGMGWPKISRLLPGTSKCSHVRLCIICLSKSYRPTLCQGLEASKMRSRLPPTGVPWGPRVTGVPSTVAPPLQRAWDGINMDIPVVSVEGEEVLWDPYPPPARHPHSALVTQKSICDSLHVVLVLSSPGLGPLTSLESGQAHPACSLPFLPLHIFFLKRVQEGSHHQVIPSPLGSFL